MTDMGIVKISKKGDYELGGGGENLQGGLVKSTDHVATDDTEAVGVVGCTQQKKKKKKKRRKKKKKKARTAPSITAKKVAGA